MRFPIPIRQHIYWIRPLSTTFNAMTGCVLFVSLICTSHQVLQHWFCLVISKHEMALATFLQQDEAIFGHFLQVKGMWQEFVIWKVQYSHWQRQWVIDFKYWTRWHTKQQLEKRKQRCQTYFVKSDDTVLEHLVQCRKELADHWLIPLYLDGWNVLRHHCMTASEIN